MRVLVTGATGFLGSHLVDRLDAAGRTVHGLKRESSTVPDRIDADVRWHEGDVRDGAAVRAAVEEVDRVYHLAGLGLARADPTTVREVNVEGTRAVLAACRGRDVERVLFTSTAGTRRGDGVADETDSARPVGAYQKSKSQAERLVDEYANGDADAVTVHPTSVFGPGDGEFTARLLALATDAKMIAYLPGGASIVGVDDVVDGIVAAMERGHPGEHYILGGENLTYREALAVIADEIGGSRPVVRVPGRVVRAAGPVAELVDAHLGRRVFPFDRDMARLATERLFYSSEKARRDLGYESRPLREHVAPAFRWFRDRES